MDKLTPGTIVDRITSETPPFFKKIRTLMITVGAIGGALLAAPVVLPPLLITVAGYLVTVGSVGAVLSQMTVQSPQQ